MQHIYYMNYLFQTTCHMFILPPLQNLFRVDPQNGRIYVDAQLDSKRTSIVSYGIEVTDIKATPVQIGIGTAIINIKPFNTQPPVFESFVSPIYVDEEQPIGSVIISLIATDDNGIREFRIIEQPDDFFTISASTGMCKMAENH